MPKIENNSLFDLTAEQMQLNNGMRLVHIPLGENDQRFYLGATIAAGARYEDADKSGVAHFLEHMMFRGSKAYPSFRKLSKAFEWLGGEWNAATGYEHTEYYFSGHIQSWRDAIDLFAEFFCHPKMNDIATERDVIKKELQKETNEFGLLTDLDFHIYNALWPQSSLARSILGSEESIDSIVKSDLKNYRDRHYHPENIIICAIGGSADQGILNRVAKNFRRYKGRTKASDRKLAPLPRYQGMPKIVWVNNSDNEYQLQMSFVCGKEWGSDYAALGLISRILADGFSSRLGERLRETLGLVYSIDAQPNLFSDKGTFDISSSVNATDLHQFLRELLKILSKLRDKGPGKQELALAKKRAIMEVGLLASEPDYLGFRWSWALLCNRNPSLSKAIADIEAVNQEKVHQLCKKIFRMNRTALALMGPEDKDLKKQVEKLLKNSPLD